MKQANLLLTSLTVALWSAIAFISSAQSYSFSTVAGCSTNGGFVDGTNNAARFVVPRNIALDSSGTLFVTDGPDVRKVTHVGTTWSVSTLFISTDPLWGGACDLSGNIYVAGTYAIYKLTRVGADWSTSVIAGVKLAGGYRDGTNGYALFYWPSSVAVDAGGSLYVADTGNYAIRKVSHVGTNWITKTLAGRSGLGTGLPGHADGTNTNASFYDPMGIALDGFGNLYVADADNHTIRKMTPVGTNWVTTTIAGLALSSGSNDGSNSDARFNQPCGIALDESGNVYVADTGNGTIRKLVPSGTNWIVSTVGGLAGSTGSADGIGPASRFNRPYAVALDPLGSLLVGDSGNHTLRLGSPGFTLQSSVVGGRLVLAWPAAATNYIIETSSTIGPDAYWAPVTGASLVNGDTFILTNSPSVPAAFFRLRK